MNDNQDPRRKKDPAGEETQLFSTSGIPTPPGEGFEVHIPEEELPPEFPGGQEPFTVHIPEDELPPEPAVSPAPAPPPDPPPRRGRSPWMVAGAIGVVVLLFVAGILLYSQFFSNQSKYSDALESAQTLLDLGDYEGAIEAYSRALEILPGGQEAIDGQVSAYLALSDQALEAEDYEGAVRFLEKCLELSKDSAYQEKIDSVKKEQEQRGQQAQVEELEQRAAQSVDEKKYQEAMEVYQQILDLTGDQKYADLIRNLQDLLDKEEEQEAQNRVVQSSLPSGSYSSEQVVGLTCKDPTAVIYYTLDGSTPGQGSTRYAGVIRLEEGNWTLRAVSYVGSTRSEESSWTYQITYPTQPPTEPPASQEPQPPESPEE